ncbi:hypothetical protein EJB05_26525, partial [Eragrostis curvula]
MEVLTRLLPKLAELLVGEYNLQKEVKGGIKFLQVELEHMKAALEKISSTPADQLDKQDKIWARDVRELSYDIEDMVDTFMVRCKGRNPDKQHGFKKIATDIRDIKSRVEEVGKRRDRYKLSTNDIPKPVRIDPRLLSQYKNATELVGIDEARDELIRILIEGNEVSMKQGKIMSIVGFGGLGKTTLAHAVYEKISAQFECRAFVSVSQTPDMRKLLKHILYDVGRNIRDETLDERWLINELRQFLHEKRYLIVVDDIWDIPVWETIRCAFPHNNSGYRIIATTRNVKVAEHAGGAYNMKPLSPHNSRILLNRRVHHDSTSDVRSMAQVRSVVVFSPAINQIPTFHSFKVLRVLDLQDCNLSQGYSLKYLGSLFHLRYLNLRSTWIDQLPEEVENLQFLESLDLEYTNIAHLSLNVARLKHLLRLSVNSYTIVPNGTWSLRFLEELSWLRIDDQSKDHMEELGLLTELRVLRIALFTNKWNEKLAKPLSKLQKIHSLYFEKVHDSERNVGGLDAWVAPRHVRYLETQYGCWFSRLPAWMDNPSHLLDLSVLDIAVRELQQEDLEILGRLPALRCLDLELDHEKLGILRRFVVGSGLFPCLVYCWLFGLIVPMVFQNGAAQRLTRFDFDFHVWEARGIAGSDGGFDLGLENLPSLQKVNVRFQSGGASEEDLEEAKAAVRKVAEIHPNDSDSESWIDDDAGTKLDLLKVEDKFELWTIGEMWRRSTDLELMLQEFKTAADGSMYRIVGDQGRLGLRLGLREQIT